MGESVDGITISVFDPVRHERQGFSCGEASLDRYIHQQASQDLKRRAAVLYVLTEEAQGGLILGYYTLSACSVQLTGLAPGIQRKLARYPEVAGALIGRLAVDERQKGRGLGAALLRDALQRCVAQSQVLAMAVVVVDALNENAQRFYEHYGFLPLSTTGNRLYLPLATVQQAQ